MGSLGDEEMGSLRDEEFMRWEFRRWRVYEMGSSRDEEFMR